MPQAELLQAILDRANIGDWDVLLIGDGSGTGWDSPAGWASVLIDRRTSGRRTFYGGLNLGSINLAEMMPYFQALCWFHNAHGMERLRERCPLLVHVITDSQVTALHGNRAANRHEDLPKVGQRPLWAAVREFAALGYRIQFHWAERCESGLNYLADLIAALSRRGIMQIDQLATDDALAAKARQAIERVTFCDPATGRPISAYEINPDATGAC